MIDVPVTRLFSYTVATAAKVGSAHDEIITPESPRSSLDTTMHVTNDEVWSHQIWSPIRN